MTGLCRCTFGVWKAGGLRLCASAYVHTRRCMRCGRAARGQLIPKLALAGIPSKNRCTLPPSCAVKQNTNINTGTSSQARSHAGGKCSGPAPFAHYAPKHRKVSPSRDIVARTHAHCSPSRTKCHPMILIRERNARLRAGENGDPVVKDSCWRSLAAGASRPDAPRACPGSACGCPSSTRAAGGLPRAAASPSPSSAAR